MTHAMFPINAFPPSATAVVRTPAAAPPRRAMLPDEEELRLSDKFIGDEKIKVLCDKLRAVQKRKLNLRGNNLGVVGAKTVADFIGESSTIQQLSLEWNLIGSSGAHHFANALLANRSMVHLDLRNNSISSDAAIALAESLQTNNVLTTLDLRWNQIDDRGALAFKFALLERRPRLNLLITGNLLSESALSTISAWMNKQDVDIPVPPPAAAVPKNVQDDLLSKDINELRRQITALHATVVDLQRQNDTSALRVTELEQLLAREQYRSGHLQEQLQQATLRISILNDERASFLASWEKERTEMVNETLQMMKDKEAAVRDALLQRDALQDRYVQLEDDSEQLRLQHRHLQEQLDTERERNQEELRLVRVRLTEYSISESKLKTEQIASRAEIDRLSEKIKMLEEELRLRGSEYTKQLAAYELRYEEDMRRLQANHAQAVAALMEKNAVLTGDVTALQAIINTLRTELITQKRELEEVYEGALAACRQAEQQRAEQMASELRKRIDLLTAAKLELEHRCEHHISEIATLRAEHEDMVARMSAQLAAMQAELQRLRDQNASLHSALTANEAQCKAQEIELRDVQRRLGVAEDSASRWNRELQAAQAAKVKLEEQLQKLQEQLAQLKANRIIEYATIRQNVLASVSAQFDSMRVDLSILEAPGGKR